MKEEREKKKKQEMVLARNLIEKKRATTRCSSSNKEDTPCRGGSQSTDLSSSSSSLINLIINKQTKDFRKLNKPGPKTRRSKTRKPKYLSLRLQFSTDKTKSQESSETPISTITTTSSTDHHPQLNLFPLHPENLVDDKEAHDENNMAYLFSAADGGATTLTGLLGTSSNSSISDEDNKDHNSTSSLSPSASLTYAAYGRRDREEEVALVRTAIRNKEREPSEERWVHYSEVVERPRDEEVSSCGADRRPYQWKNQRLSLKLDYEEILNAWSDKGPLYIHAAAAAPQSLQVVPDIHDHHFLASEISNGMISDGWGNNGGCVWRVPELMTSKGNDEQDLRLVKVKTEEQQELVAVGRREASVQRYKEKRQNRLFSKRIRYQVRKQNAEKRPRLKGRFVKRG